MRKSLWQMTAIIGYVAIMLFNPTIEPMALGLGLGFLLAPNAAANAMEHKFKNGK